MSSNKDMILATIGESLITIGQQLKKLALGVNEDQETVVPLTEFQKKIAAQISTNLKPTKINQFIEKVEKRAIQQQPQQPFNECKVSYGCGVGGGCG